MHTMLTRSSFVAGPGAGKVPRTAVADSAAWRHSPSSAARVPAPAAAPTSCRAGCSGSSGAQRSARTVARATPLDRLRDLLGGGGQQLAQPAAGEEEDLGEMASLADMATPAGTEDVFGPTAALLIGFMGEEVTHFQSILRDMGADMVAVIPASKSMMAGSLQAALEGGAVAYAQPPLGQRRAVILSGMFTNEVMEVIGAYKDAGLPPTVFAAAVPNNYERPIADVVDSCWKDQIAAQQRVAMGKMVESIEDM